MSKLFADAMMAAALAYAQLDLRVLPLWNLGRHPDGTIACGCPAGRNCKNKPGKHPIGFLARHGVKDATTDANIIRKWWSTWDNTAPNIGIATGDVVVVADIDPRNGGAESLTALEEKHGALPASWMVRTGDGIHHYFRPPLGVKIGSGTIAPVSR
jgi:hypothetical protein